MDENKQADGQSKGVKGLEMNERGIVWIVKSYTENCREVQGLRFPESLLTYHVTQITLKCEGIKSDVITKAQYINAEYKRKRNLRVDNT
ncbi:hypothetical protein CP083_00930 [Candidatus Bathyarchaeota archaeon B24-2]|nr:MAG: hypothetical protein CP083_00930 [Candidatus Bathyarchaeota archaeon B24-2]